MRAIVVQPVRIYHGQGARQSRLGYVMIDDDDFQPRSGGLLQRLEGGYPAIDGNDNRDSFRR